MFHVHSLCSGMTRQVGLAHSRCSSGQLHVAVVFADIAEMERLVRSVVQDGLVWGACKCGGIQSC